MGQMILFIYLLIPFLANESIIDRVNNYCEEKEGKTLVNKTTEQK